MIARALILAVVLIGCATPVLAQVICSHRESVVRQLKDNHDEEPVARGLSATGRVVELFASPKGSWTIVATRPSGLTCLIDAGEAWEPIEPTKSPRPKGDGV